MADALSLMLAGVRPHGALYDHAALDTPWAVRFEPDSPLVLVAMLRGEGWIQQASRQPFLLTSGSVALLTGETPYAMSGESEAPVGLAVGNGRCAAPEGRSLERSTDPCGAPWGPTSSTIFVSVAFPMRSSLSARLLDALPPLAAVAPARVVTQAVDAVATELSHDRPGQAAVLERLLELLLVASLREWFDQPGSDAPLWYRAHADAVVGGALALVHAQPEAPWTVAALADQVAVSRSALARRFVELLGEPPMGYLARWRVCLAADLLRDTDDTVETIARKVGYGNGYALSAAFKRLTGLRPSEHRRATTAGSSSLGCWVPAVR